MTIFSIVVMLVIWGILYRNRKFNDIFISLFAFSTSLEIMISVGYFLKIGSFELGYSEFLILLTTVMAVGGLVRLGRMSSKRFVVGSLLVLSCVISLLLQVIVPYKEPVVNAEALWDLIYFRGYSAHRIQVGMIHIKEIVHLICFVVSMWYAVELEYGKIWELVSRIYYYCRYFVIFGMIEIVLVYILGQKLFLYSVEQRLLGNSYFNNAGTISMGVSNRLRGLKSEPSMYGFALMVFIVLCIFLYIKGGKREYKIWGIIAGIIELATLSMTAVVCGAALFFFYFVYQCNSGNSKKKIRMLSVLLVAVLTVMFAISYIYINDFDNYYLHRLHLTLLNLDNLNMSGWNGDYANTDASTRIRLISIVETAKYWVKRPVFGLGLGSVYAHSPLMTYLASTGICGLILWIKFVLDSNTEKNGLWAYKIGWCMMLILAGSGLFPFYGYQNIILYYGMKYVLGKEKGGEAY